MKYKRCANTLYSRNIEEISKKNIPVTFYFANPPLYHFVNIHNYSND